MLICPWPDINYCIKTLYVQSTTKDILVEQELNDYFLAGMSIRIFFIIRTMSHFTIYSNSYSYNLCQDNGFQNNLKYYFKCYFKSKPVYTVAYLFTSFVLIFAYIVRIFELPMTIKRNGFIGEALQIANFSDSFYLTFITITTIGYGDIVPHSYPGRATMMIAAAIGAVLTSLIIIAI